MMRIVVVELRIKLTRPTCRTVNSRSVYWTNPTSIWR